MAASNSRQTIGITLGVCLVCSVLVSVAAVTLKPIQRENAETDKLKNILIAAGLYDDKADVQKIFSDYIHPVLIDLASGSEIQEPQDPSLSPDQYDLKAVAKNPATNRKIDADKDLAHIREMPKFMLVYQVLEGDSVDQWILPVYGKGLWSTLYGLLALDHDLKTVRGFTFYEHGETPGLGGEVDNPAWKRQWIGKKISDGSGALRIQVIKAKVSADDPDAAYKIDGLSGSTLTTRGVNNLIQFWLGEEGYATFMHIHQPKTNS